MSFASCMFVGSSMGMLADSAMWRESNSFVLECALGSSLVTTTTPPLIPCCAAQNNASAMHSSPFCFTMQMERAPAKLVPRQAWNAQISFVAHWA